MGTYLLMQEGLSLYAYSRHAAGAGTDAKPPERLAEPAFCGYVLPFPTVRFLVLPCLPICIRDRQLSALWSYFHIDADNEVSGAANGRKVPHSSLSTVTLDRPLCGTFRPFAARAGL